MVSKYPNSYHKSIPRVKSRLDRLSNLIYEYATLQVARFLAVKTAFVIGWLSSGKRIDKLRNRYGKYKAISE
jgi:hypothetical protein